MRNDRAFVGTEWMPARLPIGAAEYGSAYDKSPLSCTPAAKSAVQPAAAHGEPRLTVEPCFRAHILTIPPSGVVLTPFQPYDQSFG
jgi:hypothetical protein